MMRKLQVDQVSHWELLEVIGKQLRQPGLERPKPRDKSSMRNWTKSPFLLLFGACAHLQAWTRGHMCVGLATVSLGWRAREQRSMLPGHPLLLKIRSQREEDRTSEIWAWSSVWNFSSSLSLMLNMHLGGANISGRVRARKRFCQSCNAAKIAV